MGVDKQTAPSYINLWIDDNPQMLKELRDRYKEEGIGEDEKKQLVLCNMNGFSLSCEEYYLDEHEGKPELYFSFSMEGANGRATGTISIPLSDIVLIDILQYSIKRLNKLKTVIEVLK